MQYGRGSLASQEELEHLQEEFEARHGRNGRKDKKDRRARHEGDEQPNMHQRESGRSGRPAQQTPESQTVQVAQIVKEERPMVSRPQNDTHNAYEPSPFASALNLARQIEDRNADTSPLHAMMDRLDDEGRKNLVFRLVGMVLEGDAKVPGLFAAARMARMISVAHNTAAMYKAMRHGGLTLQDLITLQLAKITTFTDNSGKMRSRTTYRVGHEALKAAATELRNQRRIGPAEILENALLEAEKQRLHHQAIRDAKSAAASAVEEPPATETPAPEPPKSSRKRSTAKA